MQLLSVRPGRTCGSGISQETILQKILRMSRKSIEHDNDDQGSADVAPAIPVVATIGGKRIILGRSFSGTRSGSNLSIQNTKICKYQLAYPCHGTITINASYFRASSQGVSLHKRIKLLGYLPCTKLSRA